MRGILNLLIIAVAAVALVVSCIPADSSNHSATPTWSAAPTAGVTYNVYKANCLGTVTNNVCSQEGAFTLLVNVPNTQFSYFDTNVTAGGLYVYMIRSYCDATANNCGPSVAAGESIDSPHYAVSVPKDKAGAPPSLTVPVQ